MSSNEEDIKLIEEVNAVLREQFARKPEDLVGYIYLLRFGAPTRMGLAATSPTGVAGFDPAIKPMPSLGPAP